MPKPKKPDDDLTVFLRMLWTTRERQLRELKEQRAQLWVMIAMKEQERIAALTPAQSVTSVAT